MKRYCALLLLGLATLPWLALADIASPSDGAPPPVQSFQQASDMNHDAVNIQKEPTKTATTPPPSVTHSEDNPTIDRESATMLQAELTQLNQNNLLFQQQTDERLIELAAKNQQLQQQLHQLTQALMLLNQEMAQVKQASGTLSQVQNAVDRTPLESPVVGAMWLLSLKQKVGPVNFDIAIVLLALVVLLLMGTSWRRKKVKKVSVENDDTKDEYDYMGSAESIPAKLNLVRAYIAMEEYDPARKVLSEVAISGNAEQKQEADELLKTLPAES